VAPQGDPLDEVSSVKSLKGNRWYGWGNPPHPSGWPWNVSGLDGVEFRLESGKAFSVGTDEPDALLTAITPWI